MPDDPNLNDILGDILAGARAGGGADPRAKEQALTLALTMVDGGRRVEVSKRGGAYRIKPEGGVPITFGEG